MKSNGAINKRLFLKGNKKGGDPGGMKKSNGRMPPSIIVRRYRENKESPVVASRPLWTRRKFHASMLMPYTRPSIDGFSSRRFYCSEASTDTANIEFFGISEILPSTVAMRTTNHAVPLRNGPIA